MNRLNQVYASLHIRNFRWQNLPAVAELDNRLLKRPFASSDARAEFLSEFLRQPNLRPEDDMFLAFDGDALLGCGLLVWEPKIGRSVLDLRAVTEGGDVDKILIEAGRERAVNLGASTFQVQSAEGSARTSLLRQLNFSHVRDYWNMRWPIQSLAESDAPDGFAFRSYGADNDASVLAEIQNAAFGGSWGFCPNTAEEIAYRASMKITGPKGIIFLCQGDVVLGYCWTHITADASTRTGVISMIGTHPERRSRGLGRMLLSRGLRYLSGEGVDYVELEVDGANGPATNLYLSIGFERVSINGWHQLEL